MAHILVKLKAGVADGEIKWPRGDSFQCSRYFPLMTDHPLLIQRLVEALLHAQYELLLVNGCAVTDSPDIEARLPARLSNLFWRADPVGSLQAIEDALEAAAAEGFPSPATVDPIEVEIVRPGLRLAVNNDA